MAYGDMIGELIGAVNRLSPTYAGTLINRAWNNVGRARIWSFNLGHDTTYTPNVLSAGTFTVTFGSQSVTADATASALILAQQFPLITDMQFRIQGYSIYDIIGVNVSNPSAVVLTLDVPFADPTAGNSLLPYMIYQAYKTAPVKSFKRFLDIRDMVNGAWLDLTKITRRDIDKGDPQRLYFTFPRIVVGYQTDTRLNSSTLGWMRYEWYPNPVQQISYMRWWLQDVVDLVNDSDTLPYPMSQSCVLALARKYAYEWAEANRDPTELRGQNADYFQLMAEAERQYLADRMDVWKKDRDLIDLYLTKIVRYDPSRRIPYFSTLTNRAFSG